jgi:hypothetical protein
MMIEMIAASREIRDSDDKDAMLFSGYPAVIA